MAQMHIDIRWHSQKGTKTSDNRDYAGVGIRDAAVLCIVLDGSTFGPKSGELARDLACKVVDWYVATNDKISQDLLTFELRQLHKQLSERFPRGSASYMIIHAEAGHAIFLHAGDCVLGYRGDKPAINWLTQPHTLATAFGETSLDQLARIPARHLLTRSFRSKEFVVPEALHIDLKPGALVAATDGFWAELDSTDQALFMDGQFAASEHERDDRSALCCLMTGAEKFSVVLRDRTSPNFYHRRASR